jgi:hypothetical protein
MVIEHRQSSVIQHGGKLLCIVAYAEDDVRGYESRRGTESHVREVMAVAS